MPQLKALETLRFEGQDLTVFGWKYPTWWALKMIGWQPSVQKV